MWGPDVIRLVVLRHILELVLFLSIMRRYRNMATVYKPGRKLPSETELPALWFWVHCSSELWEKKFFFFCFYHPIYSIIFLIEYTGEYEFERHYTPNWRKAWWPTPVFLPGESHGQRILAGYSPWCCKESGTTERLTHTPDTNCLILFLKVFSITEQEGVMGDDQMEHSDYSELRRERGQNLETLWCLHLSERILERESLFRESYKQQNWYPFKYLSEL